MTSKRRRSESEYASQRKMVRLADLKVVDLVKTGDELEFKYQNKTFRASVTREGFIAAKDALSSTKRAVSVGVTESADVTPNAGGHIYRMPSNFTLDCVDTFWRDRGNSDDDACKTNPSGYERVRHVPSGKSLNALRDQYMELYSDAGHVRTPEDIQQGIALRTASRSRSRQAIAPEDEELPASSADEAANPGITAEQAAAEAVALIRREPLTVATLRAETGATGYKAVAEDLESKMARLIQTLAVAETLLDGVVRAIDEPNAAVPTAQHPVVAEARRHVQAFQTHISTVNDGAQDMPLHEPAVVKTRTATPTPQTIKEASDIFKLT